MKKCLDFFIFYVQITDHFVNEWKNVILVNKWYNRKQGKGQEERKDLLVEESEQKATFCVDMYQLFIYYNFSIMFNYGRGGGATMIIDVYNGKNWKREFKKIGGKQFCE